MPLTVKPLRYAHPEGHTDVSYFSGEKGGLITCGSDGDVRYWLDLMDDDPSCQCVGEQATSCLSKDGKIFAGNDSNTIQILSYPDLEKSGIVTRFSATVSALATTKKSRLIVSGSCDMRIQVTNIDTSDSIELNGHEAPILGLTLDPKEQFVASSSADGTIRIWNLKEKKQVYTWNVVPKSNSFFTAKCLSTPSFDPKDGKFLAYPNGKEIVIVERDSWKEMFRLKCTSLKANINICKVSECGTRLAAASTSGEIVVWNIQTQDEIGYVEHPGNSKITSLVWHLEKSTEIAFCDSVGQLGCVDVESHQVSLDDFVSEPKINGHNTVDDTVLLDILDKNDDDDDDDDGENVISLNKIKSAAEIDDDQLSHSDASSFHGDSRKVLPEIHLQQPFQPSSTPVHLLSRFMTWNNVGIVRCYSTEDGDESTIEVEFHDANVHHSMHMNNYLRHTMAALSTQALVLACQSFDGEPSKLVVVALQGWGSGNKEWTINLPEGEEASCVAAGDTFVALATSRRHLRIFLISGIQREVISIPGSVVTMSGYGNHLLVAYHSGVGVSKDQVMSLMWIHIQGTKMKCQTLPLPLSPSSDLMWLGMSDLSSPLVMDADGVMRMYSKDLRLWRVAADTDKQCKGKMDHYFIVGVSESERCIRGILCKGSHYPATSPRPSIIEIPLSVPLCEIDSEKTQKEAPLWQIGSNPTDETSALFTLIGFSCNGNVDYRVVDLCQNIAPQNIIELAIKYAGKCGKMSLANKLQKIAEEKHRQKEQEIDEQDLFADEVDDAVETIESQEEEIKLTPVIKKSTEIEIKPLAMTFKKKNPFAKKSSPMTTNKLEGLNALPEKLEKPKVVSTITLTKPKSKLNSRGKKETFIGWLEKNKADLKEEFPDLSDESFRKEAFSRYNEEQESSEKKSDSDTKKRKLSSPEENEKKKKTANKLTAFLYDK